MQLALPLWQGTAIVSTSDVGERVVSKAWVATGALIALAGVGALRVALTDEYAHCKNARAITYVDDLAPTIGEEVFTVASCEQTVIHSNSPSTEMALTLAAAAAFLCSLFYSFGSRPPTHNDHAEERSADSYLQNRHLPSIRRAANRRPLEENTAIPSHIGPTVALNGVLCSDGDFHVEGSVNGGIQCANLVIEGSGKVYGDIVANRVLIRGQFKGVLRANEVTLAPGSHIEGTVWQKSLRIDAGARFDGECRHSSAPLANMETKLLVEPVPSLQDLPQKVAAMVGG